MTRPTDDELGQWLIKMSTMTKPPEFSGYGPASDRELAQAYSQGYQDGRRGLESELRLAAAARYAYRKHAGIEFGDKWTAFEAWTHVRDAVLAKVSQPQPATKGE